MIQIIYRKANGSDINSLVDFRFIFFSTFPVIPSDEEKAKLREELTKYFSESLNDDSYISYIAESEKRIVGIGGMSIRSQPGNYKNPSGRVGYIVNMYTDPLFRKMGIGSTILEKLSIEAINKNVTLLELHSTDIGESVYRRFGFELHSQPTYRKYLPGDI